MSELLVGQLLPWESGADDCYTVTVYGRTGDVLAKIAHTRLSRAAQDARTLLMSEAGAMYVVVRDADDKLMWDCLQTEESAA